MLKKYSIKAAAPGRLDGSGPVSIIDIGSNSVRLVVYERLARSPTMLFNEKVLAGLGRGLSLTGRLSDEAVARALAALSRFRRLTEQAQAVEMCVVATAAARDADNGAEFIHNVESVLGAKVRLLSGRDEARYAALGVACGIWRPEGVVGDLGGGSLELVSISPSGVGKGTTLPLGGLRLQDEAAASVRQARRIASAALTENHDVPLAEGQALYLIGGTWRSLARLHMARTDYPMHVMHQYGMTAKAALEFCDEVMAGDLDAMKGIEHISRQRKPLVPFGAAVLSEVVRVTRPDRIVLSALGVREGILFEMLDDETRAEDPLLAGAGELGYLRGRSPAHTGELIGWTKGLLTALGLEETLEQERLREAACLVSDLGWRAHPDYRGEQSFDAVAYADFVGIDHPGRAFLAACVFFRHVGADGSELNPMVRKLIDEAAIERAMLLGLGFRIAYLVSASMPGILPETRLECADGTLKLVLPPDFVDLDGERLQKRLAALARLCKLDRMAVVPG